MMTVIMGVLFIMVFGCLMTIIVYPILYLTGVVLLWITNWINKKFNLNKGE